MGWADIEASLSGVTTLFNLPPFLIYLLTRTTITKFPGFRDQCLRMEYLQLDLTPSSDYFHHSAWRKESSQINSYPLTSFPIVIRGLLRLDNKKRDKQARLTIDRIPPGPRWPGHFPSTHRSRVIVRKKRNQRASQTASDASYEVACLPSMSKEVVVFTRIQNSTAQQNEMKSTCIRASEPVLYVRAKKIK